MKCDELTPIDLECNMGKDINGVEHREPWKAYDIDEVNAAIAELKDENRRLKRALWLARSYMGRDNSILLPSKFMRNVWDNVERKCIKKAEEYK